VISRLRFIQIETRIREQEQTKLADVEKQLRMQLRAEQTAEVARQREDIEANARIETAKRVAAVVAEKDRITESLRAAEAREIETRRTAQEEAERREAELTAQAEKLRAELTAERDQMAEKIRVAESREAIVRKEAEAQAAEELLRVSAERDAVADKAQKVQAGVDAYRKQAEDDLAKLKNDAEAQRNSLLHQLKEAQALGTALAASVQEKADAIVKVKLSEFDSQRQKDLAEQRAALERDRDQAVLNVHADFNREREGLQSKVKEMERQLQKKTSQDLGEGAEIDLYETLRQSFADDRITRVQKGQPGADIHQDVMYKGQSCGKIVIDSKNRQKWGYDFVAKLRQDQTEAGAEHAILASTVFPSGKKELCLESDVIVVSPARAVHIVSLLRRSMISAHVRGLSLNERATKMTKLYKLITSEAYAQRFREVEKLTADILELDVQEKKSHDNVWRKRGSLATRMNNVLREIDTEVAGVIEGQDNNELSAAS
jgi:hypothetical protein